MNYYIRPATKDTNLLLIATDETGTEMIELSSEHKVLIQYSTLPANLPEGLQEITNLEYIDQESAIKSYVSPFVYMLTNEKVTAYGKKIQLERRQSKSDIS